MLSAIERLVMQREQRAQIMRWRITRYGGPCLTAREFEALCLEQEERAYRFQCAPDTAPDVRYLADRGIQERVAQRMGISHQRVSQLLQQADQVMQYFADHGIDARWVLSQSGRSYRLVAPVLTDQRPTE